ncbi:hypothetical protein PTE30175_03891 [Pandoraea terrae]|uniref:Uncharacterized protein n=1 Tax=Pandoraea terrae TaxID=1537710 RepID=A0A5E4XNQ7_9BURK|nr:hypothetical protein [Pandoraea terrae]VVE37748.1 hypothetical protein PTE30175_03891 [Pandoraea terrae]
MEPVIVYAVVILLVITTILSVPAGALWRGFLWPTLSPARPGERRHHAPRSAYWRAHGPHDGHHAGGVHMRRHPPH